MKRLLILRHGKSDWEAPYEGDHERPLTPRGERDSRRMGRWLRKLGQAPQEVLSSTAVRALRTAEIAAEAGAWDCPIAASRDLYDAHPGAVVERLRQLEESVATVLYAGHEPTVSELAENLMGGGRLHFPTAAVARLDLHIATWQQIADGIGTLMWLVTPKLLAAGKRSAPVE